MKVLFDGIAMQISPVAPFHGGGEYAKYIFRSALEKGYRFDVVVYSHRITPNDIQTLIDEHGLKTIVVDTKQQLFDVIDSGDYDKFYSALPYEYDEYSGSTPLVGVIHGIRKVELPYTWQMVRMEQSLKKKVIFAAGAMIPAVARRLRKRHENKIAKLLSIPAASYITVSETTKGTLMHLFPHLVDASMPVAYSPFKCECRVLEDADRDFYLMLNANRNEKNIPMAIRAFDRLFSLGYLKGKKVMVTGCDQGAFYTRVKNPDRFIFTDYLHPDDLEQYYQKAYCLVFPSINEGFGYPPLKSMSYGVPVIASSATSIPEACGGAALFFDPFSEHDLCTRILMMETSPEIYAEYKRKGLARAEEVQQIIARQLDAVLKDIFAQ